MNYYIQGDPDRADKIKAAFEKLGIDVLDFGFGDRTLVYCSIGGCGGCVQSLPYSINLMHILHSHPDYQELERDVKSKFKVGEWIVQNDGSSVVPIQIYNLKKNRYLVTNILGSKGKLMLTCQDKWHLWTIADAKDGDVLATDNGWTCIFKAFDGWTFSSYCFMDSEKWFCEFGSEVHTPDSRLNGKIHPATKEQRELLFQKIKESGYEWDADKKELKKIPKHYDIANFQPRQWVLVRQGDGCAWRLDIFSNLKEGTVSQFECVGNSMVQCIPFDGNENLLGTTDPCDEFYINW